MPLTEDDMFDRAVSRSKSGTGMPGIDFGKSLHKTRQSMQWFEDPGQISDSDVPTTFLGKITNAIQRFMGGSIQKTGSFVDSADSRPGEFEGNESPFDPRRYVRSIQHISTLFNKLSNFISGDDTDELDVGGYLQGYGASIVEAAPPSKSVAEDGSFQPGNPDWWLERGLEFLPQLALQAGLAIATKGQGLTTQLSVFAVPVAILEGGAAFDSTTQALVKSGMDKNEAMSIASDVGMFTAIGSAVLEGVSGAGILFNKMPGLNQVFTSKLLEKAMSSFAGRFATGYTVEGVTELAQEAWADTVQYLATNDPDTFKDFRGRYPASFTLGGLAGGLVSSVAGGKGDSDINTGIEEKIKKGEPLTDQEKIDVKETERAELQRQLWDIELKKRGDLDAKAKKQLRGVEDTQGGSAEGLGAGESPGRTDVPDGQRLAVQDTGDADTEIAKQEKDKVNTEDELLESAIDDVSAVTPIEPEAPKTARDFIERDAGERSPEGTTSIRNVDTQAVREKLGQSRVPSPETQTHQQLKDKSRKQGLDKKAVEIAAQVILNPRPLTDIETAAMGDRFAQLQVSHAEMAELSNADGLDISDARILDAEMTRIEQDLHILTLGSNIGGTDVARALESRKIAIKLDDFTLANVRNRARGAKGSELTASQKSRFDNLTKRLKDTEAKLEAAEKRASESFVDETIKQHRRPGKKRSVSDLDQELNGILEQTSRLLRAGCLDS